MRARKLDKNGDYVFGNGENNYLLGLDAVAQTVRTRLLLLYQEWWEDQEDGTLLFQSIIGKAATPDNKQAADLVIRSRILSTPGVIGITAFESRIDRRNYTVAATLDTAYGTAELEVSL